MGIRHFLLLLSSVLCLSTADAFAQNDAERMAEVLCLDDKECLALARYRLTANNLRRMFAADRELMPLLKDLELHKRMSDIAQSIDPQGKLGTVTSSGQAYERVPEIAQVLRRHQISGPEYAFTHAVAMVTAMSDDTFGYDAQGGRKEIPPEMLTPAWKFWRSMDPALKAEADAWKKMRGYDKGLNR